MLDGRIRAQYVFHRWFICSILAVWSDENRIRWSHLPVIHRIYVKSMASTRALVPITNSGNCDAASEANERPRKTVRGSWPTRRVDGCSFGNLHLRLVAAARVLSIPLSLFLFRSHPLAVVDVGKHEGWWLCAGRANRRQERGNRERGSQPRYR